MPGNSLPYLEIIKSTDGQAYRAFTAFRLDSIEVRHAKHGDSRTYVARMLNRQMDFISTLPALGADGAIELRFLSWPKRGRLGEGRVDVLIRIRKDGKTENEARTRALAVYKGIRANLVSVDEAYNWVPIAKENEYREAFHGSKLLNAAEIARREAIVNLDRLDVLPRRRAPGFTEQPAAEKIAGNSVYTWFPFIRTHATLSRLFRILLMQDDAVVISIALTPAKISQAELDYLVLSMEQCERYLQLPVSGSVWDASDLVPPLHAQATELLKLLQRAASTLRDDCALFKVQIVSQHPLSEALIEAVGAVVTEPVGSTDEESDASTELLSVAGGYDWYAPESAAEKAIVLENFENIQFTPWIKTVAPNKEVRLRYMVGAREANCAFRFPIPVESIFPGLDTRLARTVPPPANLPEQGMYIGENLYRGMRQPIYLLDDDRRRHTYIVGQTGTGKSSLLLNMIMQDIEAGKGVGVIDPHGELVDEVLARIPKRRVDDVHYINPEQPDTAIGLNMLQYRDDIDRDSAVNHLLEMFQRLYGKVPESMGPAFEMYFRNSALLEMADSSEVPILDGILRIFSDKIYRQQKLSKCTDPLVQAFWKIAQRAQGDHTLENYGTYVNNKLSRILYNRIIRRMALQRESTIDFDGIINNGKILLVDLCKGKLGETNAAFLAMVLISLIQRAAFARTSERDKSQLRDFYLYIDEFQNVATDSFVTILSEARKYRLNAILANQYIHQIPEDVREAVRGNVGTIIAFRAGARDAELLEQDFAPSVTRDDLMNLSNYQAYVSTLARGEAIRAFSIRTVLNNSKSDPTVGEAIMRGTSRYSRPVQEVEEAIEARWATPTGSEARERD